MSFPWVLDLFLCFFIHAENIWELVQRRSVQSRSAGGLLDYSLCACGRRCRTAAWCRGDSEGIFTWWEVARTCVHPLAQCPPCRPCRVGAGLEGTGSLGSGQVEGAHTRDVTLVLTVLSSMRAVCRRLDASASRRYVRCRCFGSTRGRRGGRGQGFRGIYARRKDCGETVTWGLGGGPFGLII